MQGTQFIRPLSVVVAFALAAVLILVQSPSAESVMGPKLTVVQPTPDQVITESEFSIVFDVESRFPIEGMRVTSRAFDDNGQWWGTEFECNESGTRCEIFVDVREWEDIYNFWWIDGRFPIRVTAMDKYRVAGPPVQVIINLNLHKCGGIVYSPAPGDEVSGTVRVNVVPDCFDGIWGGPMTELYVDGELEASEPFEDKRLWVHLWDSRTVPNGPHTLSVGGFDGTTRDPPGEPITVIVNNPPKAIVGLPSSNWTPGKRLRKQKVSLRTAAGEPLAGREVWLKVESENGSKIHRVDLKATTGQDGIAIFAFDKPIRGPHTLLATFPGDGVHPRHSVFRANKASWTVRYSVKLKRDKRGPKIVATVKIRPAQKETVFLTVFREGDVSATLTQGETNRKGVHRFRLRPDWRGEFVAQVIVQESSFRRQWASPGVDLVVK